MDERKIRYTCFYTEKHDLHHMIFNYKNTSRI